MSAIVVDSSVAIKWLISYPDSTKAREILDAYQQDGLLLLAPDLIYAEVGNIIWKFHRFQGLSQSDALEILQIFQTIDLIIKPSSLLLSDAYQIASTHQRTVYDSLYIALSLRQGCPFLTADEKLVNSVRSSFSNVFKLSDWNK